MKLEIFESRMLMDSNPLVDTTTSVEPYASQEADVDVSTALGESLFGFDLNYALIPAIGIAGFLTGVSIFGGAVSAGVAESGRCTALPVIALAAASTSCMCGLIPLLTVYNPLIDLVDIATIELAWEIGLGSIIVGVSSSLVTAMIIMGVPTSNIPVYTGR